MINEYRPLEDRKINAKDVAERLLPDLDMNELIAWSPDLFAYTSYIMSLTGAYQLVVSPPMGKQWQPTNKELREWLGIEIDENDKFKTDRLKDNIKTWLYSFVRESLNKEEYESEMNPDKKRKWGFNAEKWSGFETSGEYFSESHVEAVFKKADTFDKGINQIASHVADYVRVDLAELKLALNDVEDFNNNKKYYIDESNKKVRNIEDTKYYSFDSDKKISLKEFLKYDDESNWVQFVQAVGDSWSKKLKNIKTWEFWLINDGKLDDNGNPIYDKETGEQIQWDSSIPKEWGNSKETLQVRYATKPHNKVREEDLLGILLKYAPPLLTACWAYFYNEEKKRPIAELLCNRDDIQADEKRCEEIWKISQSLLTMHAIADICCTKWGIETVEKNSNKAQWFAERLLFDKGSMSTIKPERCRIMPKRHNPNIGITLRSLSSNLSFHRSSIDVVWRKSKNTFLEEKIKEKGDYFSILLFPFPLDVKAKDFGVDEFAESKLNFDKTNYGFFEYSPETSIDDYEKVIKLIERAGEELKDERFVDLIVFPEDSLSKEEYENLAESIESADKNEDTEIENAKQKGKFRDRKFKAPSLFIAGVRESRNDIYNALPEEVKSQLLQKARILTEKEIDDIKKNLDELNKNKGGSEAKDDLKKSLEKTLKTLEKKKDNYRFLINRIINFARNAVYCKFYDNSKEAKSYYPEQFENFPLHQTPKYKQYKHHRWRLDSSQITRYGLSQILDEEKIWWEAIKIPRRRVGFLNVGNKITISNLVCEDLARQDPIADLIRHVGPSLVVTLLMDGPQLKNRWSARYASVLSDDPGSSVIALTSWGMVKRHSSAYGLMSKVIALWSDGKQLREIELADGAEAVLLNLKLDGTKEVTADGRQERIATTVLRLVDVIQIYPEKLLERNNEVNSPTSKE